MTATSNVSLSPDVLRILDGSRIDNNVLFLPPQRLDRPLYMAVDKAIQLLGGKWNRQHQGHVFDADPTDRIESVINSGVVCDLKKSYQFFPTPAPIATRLADLAHLDSASDALEPHGGLGAIAQALLAAREDLALTLVELDPTKAAHLAIAFPSAQVHNMDFLAYRARHDRIVMNPPFTRQQDAKHVCHAWSLLNPGGVLVSVVSESPFSRFTAEAKAFQSLLSHGDSYPIEPGIFKESGTSIRTRILVLNKGGDR